MKFKVTQKEIKNNYDIILKVGYCNLQNLLSYEKPSAYTVNRYGWASDVYSFPDFAISTGYSPFGNVVVSHKTCQKYEEQARKIREYYCYDTIRCEKAIYQLILELVREVTKC